MKYLYGPIHSRRLGFSLGVKLAPEKVCTFDCIYCQTQQPKKAKLQRFEYVDICCLKRELKEILDKKLLINYITLSGCCEPTLHKNLNRIIAAIKEVSKNKYPVALITNSSLLYRKKIRQELMAADLIIPSLDAPCAKIFKEINRPHCRLNFNKIVQGLIDLRKEFKGKIWLEIMVIKGINDDLKIIGEFKRFINQINPDKVQINLPVRPSAEKVKLVSEEAVKEIKNVLGKMVEII